ncbi:MAG TPA: hypothetical protein VD884_06515 [Ohtaekwangia sp.]|nr:hypothetical protein [Ohtaekwangia sp.]
MRTIAKVRRIGNSKGVIFPKSFIDKSGITDTVQITIKDKSIVISAIQEKKKTWADFKKVKRAKAEEITPMISNKFDDTDWVW